MRVLTYVSLLVAMVSVYWMLSVDQYQQDTLSNVALANEKLETINQVDQPASFLFADTTTYISPSGHLDTLSVTIPTCDGVYAFESDNASGTSLYLDRRDSSRNNVTTICPPSSGRRLLLTFSHFDLSAGDTLFVYDGKDTLSPLIDKASGKSVSAINGGWLNSNCDPSLNPSGCLTFQFKTNGDTKAGKGWKGLVSCVQDSTTTFEKTGDIYANADCNTLLAHIDIKVPKIKVGNQGVCTITNDSVIVEYYFNDIDTVRCTYVDTLRADSILSVALPYGVYNVKFKLLKDPFITGGCFVNISTPSFVCNDTIVAAIGQGCKTFLQPDDLLESFGTCAPFENDSIKQFFVIHVESDTGRVSGTSTDPPLLSAKESGNIDCNGFYDVFVTRVIEIKGVECSIGRPDSIQYRDSCKITVNFVDGIKPVFVDILGDTLTRIDTFIGCQDIQITADHLPKPNIFDNCEVDYLAVEVPNVELEACDTNKYFFVRWFATDQCGNTSEAIQKILVQRPTAENLHAPKDTMIACGMPASPFVTGWPMLDTNDDGDPDIELVTDGGATCFLDVVFRDDTIPNCGKSIKIIRYWALRSFCRNEQYVNPADTQVIEIIDTLAPLMFKPAPGVIGSYENPYVFRTSHTTCEGIPGTIPVPGGVDSCDLDFQTQLVGLQYPNGRVDYFSDLDDPLPIGNYSVGFSHVDACGNRSDTCHIFFEIRDQQAPTPICTDELRVSITSGDFPIRPEDINNGTTDNCGIEHLFVRRSICGDISVMDPTTNELILSKYGGRIPSDGWKEYIEVGCCDINEIVRVQLLAIDGVGNFNQCWLNIYPEDHLQPLCAQLPDTIAYCDEYHSEDFGKQTDHNHNTLYDEEEWQPIPADKVDLFNEKFGNPVCTDNVSCNTIFVEQEYQLLLDLCGVQRISRRYRSVDHAGSGNVSKWLIQDILVAYRPYWEVTFPADTLFQCGAVVPEFPITVNAGGCDLLKWEYKDELFAGTGGGCYKVFRKWQLINSCVVNDNSTLVILPRDAGENGHVPHDGIRTFTSGEYVDGHFLGDYGHFSYTQVIKVTDSEAPTVNITVENDCVIGGQDCTEAKIFNITGEDCTFADEITFKYELYEGDILVASGTGPQVGYPVSAYETYRLRVEAFDNCGNSTVHEQLFGFRDCDPPTAFCNGGNLNIDINVNQQIEVPALWLNNKSIDNCDQDIQHRIWHKTVSNIPPASYETISLLPSTITLGCGDIGQSAVVLFVFDDHQNFASCSTNITIQDTEGHCPSGRRAKITGSVVTEGGEMVEGVEMHFSETLGDVIEGTSANELMEMTGIDGGFSFDAALGQDVTLIPRKNIAARNGVSTYDIVLIQKHILGITPLSSPYKYIAADVNKSGSITAFDIVQMRQLILEILPEFPNNESWRFVNASFQMDKDNPLADFEENYQALDVQGNIAINFIAVKVGDVSGNAAANALVFAEPRSSESPLQLTIEDQVIRTGERYEVSVQLADQDYEGFQFSISHPDLSLLDWTSNKLQAAHINSQEERSFLNISWNNDPNKEKSSTPTEIVLEFEAHKDGYLKDFLSLRQQIIIPEAYTYSNTIADIELVFEDISENRSFELFQNKPNPFTNTTTIGFYLPSSSPVSLRIMDVTGTVVYAQTGDYSAGTHQIILDSNQIPYKGLLYYELASATGKTTKTMLFVQ